MVDALDELIAKLEAAMEGSRELDRQIWDFLNPPRIEDVDLPENFGGPPLGFGFDPPPYSRSIDSALTLVPKADWPWNVVMTTAYRTVAVCPLDGKSQGQSDPRTGHGRASTLPLALVIAALKAWKETP